MYLNSYKPKGTQPSPKFISTSSMEEVAKFCHTFRLYIQAGKLLKSVDIPYNIVMGYLSDFVETNFYNTTLCQFIDNNIPNEEDRVGGRQRTV